MKLPETTEMRMRESKEGCQGSDLTIRIDQDSLELFAKYLCRPQQPFGRTSKTQILAKGRQMIPWSSYGFYTKHGDSAPRTTNLGELCRTVT